jgi:iron(III) transport system ATP-binding protein
VMNGGKIEQAGSPEDIYDRPRSEFVARFIGMSNVVKGTALDTSHVTLASIPLRVTGGKVQAGTGAALSIRQHDIGLSVAKPAGDENLVQGIVARHVFLGGSRDYMVEVADGTQLRVVTGAGLNIPQGEKVWMHLPPEKCRALSG